MHDGSTEWTTTIIATEYGPLVLARAVAFDGSEDDASLPRQRQRGADRDRRRPAERA